MIPRCSFLMFETTLEYGSAFSWRQFWVLLSSYHIGKVLEITCLESLWLMLCRVTWSDLPLWAVTHFDSFALICIHAVQDHMSWVMSASRSHMLTSHLAKRSVFTEILKKDFFTLLFTQVGQLEKVLSVCAQPPPAFTLSISNGRLAGVVSFDPYIPSHVSCIDQ